MPSQSSQKKNETTGASRKAKRKPEFSKIMAVIAISMWVFVNLFGMAIVIFTMDASPLTYVIPSVDAVVAIVCGYYFWKARAENQIKLKRIYGVDVKPSGEIFSNGTGFSQDAFDTLAFEDSSIV